MSSAPATRKRTPPGAAAASGTRERVLDATVRCIVDEGFQASNLARIARQAGMTTGAIQHQFGDKATLLAEVVARGIDRMVDQFGRLPGGDLDVEARVGAIVRALWQGYDASSTRASLEILFALRGDEAFRRRSLAFVAGMAERIDRLWMGTFWDIERPRDVHVEAQRLVFTTLNGLALERILVSSTRDVEPDLTRLTAGVLAILREE